MPLADAALSVLVLAPTGSDGLLAAQALREAGMRAEVLADDAALMARLEHDAGAILLAEEALSDGFVQSLKARFERQEAWSDLSLLVMLGNQNRTPTGSKLMALFGPSAAITLLERPFHKFTLVSTVRVLLRARLRQYEVRQLLEKLESAVRLRDDFVSIASHEFTSPLTALSMANEVARMQHDAGKLDAAHLERLFNNTDRQIQRLLRLTEDLLDVSRARVGRLTLKKEPTDLKALVEQVIAQSAPMVEAAGVSLTADLPAAPLVGTWDPYRIEQVAVNLISNAVKYGGGAPIRVSLTSGQGAAVLTVSDSGPGIAQADQARIFERFERSAKDHTKVGLGLGLYIVQQIAELHGGKVTLQSAPGKGSTFVVELPLS